VRYIISFIFFFFATVIFANVSTIEQNIVANIDQNNAEALNLLEKIVNINSGTDNVQGVFAVGEVLKAEFEALGFTGEWKNPPDDMHRAGTLFLTRQGEKGKKLLLIAHLDTVFPQNSPFQTFSREGNLAKGPGVSDDKGGIVLLLYALKALHAQGLLANTTITIALVGDEENSGKPTSISRAALREAAKGMDITLDFEPNGDANTVAIVRRGTAQWEIVSQGIEEHSSLIFKPYIGFGAIFELTRVLNAAHEQLSQQQYATFNPGVIIGGTEGQIDKTHHVSGYGKPNVIAQIARAQGDMRFISDEQKQWMQNTLQTIVAQSLPKTTSIITFVEGMPPMPETDESKQLLAIYSKVSTDLGYPQVSAISPDFSGGADISYVANITPANLSRLGPVGSGHHSVNESMDIKSFNINTKRAAVLIYRLTRE
jgi:glutamate carboxypeptidase